MKRLRVLPVLLAALACSCTNMKTTFPDDLPVKIRSRGSVDESAFRDMFSFYVRSYEPVDYVGLRRASQELVDMGLASYIEIRASGGNAADVVDINDYTWQLIRPPWVWNFKNGFRTSFSYTNAIFKRDFTMKLMNIEFLVPQVRPLRCCAETHYRYINSKNTPDGGRYKDERGGGSVTAHLDAGRISDCGGFITPAARFTYEEAVTTASIGEPTYGNDHVTRMSLFCTLDFRDSILLPNYGWFLETALEGGYSEEAEGLYNRTWTDLRGYWSPRKGQVFAARYFHGHTSESTPPSERFEAGSPFYGMFENYRTYFGRGIEMGELNGTRVDNFSIEYRIDVHKWARIGPFYDFGWIEGKAYNSTGIGFLFFDTFRFELSWDNILTGQWWFEHRWSF